MKRLIYILPAIALAMMTSTVTTSCDDMLDMGNDDVLYAEENHLTTANDTVNSFVGILAQLQKIAVRTNLYGELRGDLVSVSSAANANIKEIADFEVNDSNTYNAPRDYYAIINNCNYYLANANVQLSEGRYNSEKGDTVTFYPFRAEYVAVKSIRAWVYLQLAQIYGSNIPLITEPLLSIEDADQALSQATKVDLDGVCDYFIADLEPYVTWFDYPYHGNPGYSGYNGAMPSRMAVIPIQLILGDLYLWKASYEQNPTLARTAAKYYYDYIDWVPTDGVNGSNSRYKTRLTTGNNSVEWQSSNFTSGNFMKPTSDYSSLFNTGLFGNVTQDGNNFQGHRSREVISAIAMDTASAQGHFNDLRYLYSYNRDNTDIDAVLKPSDVCYAYSDGQVYYGTYSSGGVRRGAAVTEGMLEADAVQEHQLGDLRLWSVLSYNTLGDHDYQSQTISKMTSFNDFIIYRTGQVYLRLAEALNYAGFPKFALAILTTGLDNTVISGSVMPLYGTNTTDSTFIAYFNFPRNYYRTAVAGTSFNLTTGHTSFIYDYVDKSRPADGDPTIYNIGLHSRGSGWTPENEFYYPADADVPQDSTTFPVRPKWASLWPAYVTTNEVTYATHPVRDDFNSNREFNDAVAQFTADSIACENAISLLYATAMQQWYVNDALPQLQVRQQEVVDSLIDVEQALEFCFEGHRFGDLMRAAYRKGNDAYLANKVAARNPDLLGTLSNRRNWFISWRGVIGF